MRLVRASQELAPCSSLVAPGASAWNNSTLYTAFCQAPPYLVIAPSSSASPTRTFGAGQSALLTRPCFAWVTAAPTDV
eukprot:608051-Prymnesium_polylepis.2